MRSQEVLIVYILRVKKDKVHNVGKSDKKCSPILPKPYAHLHTMKKTHAKFENNQYKTARGIALTRDTHCLYIEFTMWKKLTIISKPHAHLHTMMKTHFKMIGTIL